MIPPVTNSKLTLALLGAGALTFGICGNTGARAASPAPVKLEVRAAAGAPLEPNSFEEVTARLDRGGPLYLYLSTAQWLGALSKHVATLREMATEAAGPQLSPTDTANMTRAFEVVTRLIKNSGLEEVTGVGASSLAVEPGIYRNKFFVHHYAGKGTGFLWSAFGKTPHKLDALDFLPADTALAGFSDLDLAQLIGVVRKEVAAAGVPEAQKGLEQALAQFAILTGMPFDEVMKSLGGSVGMVVTLDSKKPITVPMGGRTESIPAPRAALLLQVKDDRIFQQVDKALGANNPGIIKVEETGLKMRTMVIPALPVFQVRATVAQWGNYLVVASDDSLIRDMIAAQKSGKGIKADPEFVRLAAGMPDQGNSFQLATSRFTDAWSRFQAGMLKNQPGMSAKESALMARVFSFQKAAPAYGVSAHLENGWLSTGKGAKGAGDMIAPLMVAPVAVVAALAVPNFVKARERAKAAAKGPKTGTGL